MRSRRWRGKLLSCGGRAGDRTRPGIRHHRQRRDQHLSPATAPTRRRLLKNADIAMYRAKEQGATAIEFYSAQMSAHNVDRLALETRLKKAAPSATSSCCTTSPRSRCATARHAAWRRWCAGRVRSTGWSRPAKFIPLAEETGLIIADRRTGCCAPRANRPRTGSDAGLGRCRVAVNLSARQFYSSRTSATRSGGTARDRARARACWSWRSPKRVMMRSAASTRRRCCTS